MPLAKSCPARTHGGRPRIPQLTRLGHYSPSGRTWGINQHRHLDGDTDVKPQDPMLSRT